MSPVSLPRPLTTFACGVMVQLAFFSLSPTEAERLRELGLREGNAIHVIRNEESFICKIEASRVVLRREVAMKIFGTIQEI